MALRNPFPMITIASIVNIVSRTLVYVFWRLNNLLNMKCLSLFLNPVSEERKTYKDDSSYYHFLIASTTTLINMFNLMVLLMRYQEFSPVLLYLLLCFFIGLPLILCQMLLAQYSKTNMIFRICPIWIGIQYAMMFIIVCQVFLEGWHAKTMLHFLELAIEGTIK